MIARDTHYDRLAANRDEIVWRIITSGVLREQRNLGVDVVAEAFFDRLFEALQRHSYLGLVAWVDRTCEAYVEFPQIGSMLAGACRAVLASLPDQASLPPQLMSDLCALEQSIGGVAFKPRTARTSAGAPLDDVDAVIHGLLDQLDVTDPLTSEHSQAVSAWCARIGRRLSLSESEVTYVARCGLVHDLGKMRTPLDILRAPRSLTDSEWVLMRAHSTAGEEIVRGHQALRHLAAPVRSHHERLDGKGYPDGLVGSQITLATRVVTVADAFNAMIGRRPYRLPMSPLDAIDRLSEGRGKQFDPIVVEAMIDAVQHTVAKAN